MRGINPAYARMVERRLDEVRAQLDRLNPLREAAEARALIAYHDGDPAYDAAEEEFHRLDSAVAQLGREEDELETDLGLFNAAQDRADYYGGVL